MCLSQNSNKHDLFNEEIETDRFIIQSLAIYNPNFLDRSLIWIWGPLKKTRIARLQGFQSQVVPLKYNTYAVWKRFSIYKVRLGIKSYIKELFTNLNWNFVSLCIYVWMYTHYGPWAPWFTIEFNEIGMKNQKYFL